MKSLMIFLMAMTFNAFASVGVYNSSGDYLGSQNFLKCSTGVTCSVSSGNLVIVSSPSLVGPLTLENGEIINNTVDDTVEVLSDDNHTTLQVTGFEAKDSIFKMYADQGDDAADKFSFKYSAAGLLTFEVNGSAVATMTGSTGAFALTGPLTGDGGDALSGFLKKQVVATATTITAAQCGSTFINSGAIEIELPEASAVLGCRLTFIVGNATAFDIDPDAGDQIVLMTNAAGDRIEADAIGESVVIEAISASAWAPVGAEKGTWSDAN